MMSSKGVTSKCVELLVACQDLADLDIFTKTDPMCVLFVKQFGQWKEYDRTEAVRETLNPKFTHSFVLDYEPAIQQPLLFSVYDIDSRSSDLRHHDFVGAVDLRLDDLLVEDKKLTTTSRTLRVPGDPKSRGTLLVTTEEVHSTRGKIQIHAAGYKLAKVGLLNRKPDVFLEIARQIDSISFHPVFRSEVVPKARNPWWRPFDISIQKICNDDWERPIQFSCWHTSYGGGFKTFELIGQCTTTLRQVSNSPLIIFDGPYFTTVCCGGKYNTLEGHYRTLELVCPKKERKNKKNVTVGKIRFYQFVVDIQYSLLDYIRGGCRLRLITAIDFTASNGTLADPLSLHTLREARNNQYLNALQALGSVIARYDPEQKVAAFGFGAKPTEDAPTDYCLPLTSNTWAAGIKGVSDAYHNILPSLTFAGPTYIAPILDKAMNLADVEVTQDSQSYFVLLVITDGIINDMDLVVSKLIDASTLPLSVIMLGVGPSDFTLMEQFIHSTNAPLFDNQTKKIAQRVNIHFAALRPDAMSSGGHSLVVQETLAALSFQVLQYFKMRNLTPGTPHMTKMDPSKSWIDSKTVLDGEESGDLLKSLESSLEPSELLSSLNTSSANFRRESLKKKNAKAGDGTLNGLRCPTCGSFIEPGSNLHSDLVKVS